MTGQMCSVVLVVDIWNGFSILRQRKIFRQSKMSANRPIVFRVVPLSLLVGLVAPHVAGPIILMLKTRAKAFVKHGGGESDNHRARIARRCGWTYLSS